MSTFISERKAEALLAQLVEAQSINPPGQEETAALVLHRFFKDYGLFSELDYVKPGRPNLICRLGGRSPKPVLMFNSHLDVVPAEEGLWATPPFAPKVIGGTLYGRGSCDAKASLAAMALAFVELGKVYEQLGGTLLFTAVMGEERGAIGSKHLVAKGLTANAVIIGEPTGGKVVVSHKGRIEVTIEVEGMAVHASEPDKGLNAIYGAARVLDEVERYAGALAHRGHPMYGKPTVAATAIYADTGNHNTIPGKCRIILDRRISPLEQAETVVKEINAIVFRTVEDYGIKVRVECRRGAEAARTDSDEAIVQILRQAAYRTTGFLPDLAGFEATCDMYVFSRVGIPVVVYGPGSIVGNHCHGVNEFITINEMVKAAKIYVESALNYLSHFQG